MRAKRSSYCVAKNATLRAARPGPSLGKKRLLQDDRASRKGGETLRLCSGQAWGTHMRPDTSGPHGPFDFAQGRLARAPVPTRAVVRVGDPLGFARGRLFDCARRLASLADVLRSG
jgi:hypothetical protein